ncbi:MAG: PAS domain S-box protein [Elusimicrobia bacterium]|nr:PAS domain S-box protein [Elusimicrobiota bacterium]
MAKIAGLTTAVIGISSLASLWIADNALNAQLVRMQTLAAREVLAKSLNNDIAADFDSEQKMLPRLQAIQRGLDAEFAAAIYSDSRIIAHTNVTEVGKIQERPSTGDSDAPGIITWNGQPVVYVSVPVKLHDEDFLDSLSSDESDLAGRLIVGLPLTRVHAVRSQVFRRNAMSSALINLATIVILVLILQGLLVPISALLSAARRVGAGERGVKVPVLRQDELGALSDGFNAMVVNLDTTTLSRNALDAILSSLLDMLLVTDREGAIRRVNPAVEKMLGLSSAQLRGRRIQELVEGLLVDDAGALLPEQPPEVTVKRPNADITALLSFSGIRRKDGEYESFIFTLRDVTRRNKVEGELSRLGRILDESPNEIYMFDAKTLNFTSVNASARSNLGYSMSELLAMTPLDLKPRFTAAAFEDILVPLRSGERDSLLFETEHRRKDGSQYPVEVRLHLSAMSSPPIFVAIIQDIGERKLYESRMIQSEKLSAVGQLAAGVAHEINNPLGVILGFSQSVLKRMEPGHPWLAPLQAIERESLRCKRLVQNLLTFSRHNQRRDEEVFDLAAVVTETLTLVEAQAKVKSSALTHEKESKPVFIHADRQHLQQIIVNLCTNALDAVGENGAVVVRVNSVKRAGAVWAQLSVTDNGQGIPEAIQKKIFEPFFTTKEPGKGTGLGLALVSELIQRHGGHVDLESVPGRGTTFRVEFPSVENIPAPAVRTGS